MSRVRGHRRSIRLRGYDYSSTGLYFLTLCVEERICLFGKVVDGIMRLNSCGEIVRRGRWDRSSPVTNPRPRNKSTYCGGCRATRSGNGIIGNTSNGTIRMRIEFAPIFETILRGGRRIGCVEKTEIDTTRRTDTRRSITRVACVSLFQDSHRRSVCM